MNTTGNVKIRNKNYSSEYINGVKRNIERRKKERSRKRRNNLIKQVIKSLFYCACLFLAVWFVASYIDVIAHNLTSPEKIGNWNFFTVLINWGK